MGRMERGVKSPILHHLRWMCFFFTAATNPNRSQYHYIVFDCYNSWNVSSNLKGIMRLDDGLIIEYDSKGGIVVVDVNKKELLEKDGVDLSELQHRHIKDLSIEGDRWEGDVLDDKPCGWGILFDKDNRMVYEGFRVDNVNMCFGCKYYADYERCDYYGEWCNGMRWGRGVQFDRNGVEMRDGEWINDVPLKKRVEITSESVLVHNLIEELDVSDGCCNDEGLRELDMSVFVHLREWTVGSECFENVSEVKLIGLRELESVVIGQSSFTKHKEWYGKDPNRFFYMKSCSLLKSLKIRRYSFSDYSVCEIENMDALESIEMGDEIQESYNFYNASLKMKGIHEED